MKLSEKENLIIKEILNSSVGNSANVLNEMLNSSIEMSVPQIFTLHLSKKVKSVLQDHLDDGKLISVSLRFKGNIEGEANLILTAESAHNLVNYLTGMDKATEEYDQFVKSTLIEIGNIVLNSICGTISNAMNEFIEYSVPTYSTGNFDKILFKDFLDPKKIVFMGKTNFEISELLLSGMITVLLQDHSVKSILTSLK